MRKRGSRWRWSPRVAQQPALRHLARLIVADFIRAGGDRDAWFLVDAAMAVFHDATQPDRTG